MRFDQRTQMSALASALCLVLSSAAYATMANSPSDVIMAQAAMPPAAGSETENAQPTGPGGASEEMMDDMVGGMGQGMTGMGMGGPGMMGHGRGGWTRRAMGRPMLSGAARAKILFAIVDTNGDGALSFDEIMAVHKRVFDVIDTNKDGKVTMEELQAFIHQ